MQRLYILRHATAAAQGERPGDRERPLSPKGREEAKRLSGWFGQRRTQGLAVICSPAVRTRETLSALEGELTDPTIRVAEPLYLGTPDIYLEEAELEEANDVLIVGHNPTCAAIVASFDHPGRFDGQYAPGTLCIAERAAGRWRAVELVTPAELEVVS